MKQEQLQALDTVNLFFPSHVTGQAGPGSHLETLPTRSYLHDFHQKAGDLCSRPEGREAARITLGNDR